MFRNLSKRVEVVTPILARESKEKLWEVLDIFLRDQRQAWELGESGTFTQLHPEGERLTAMPAVAMPPN
jgi:polyphosphate kinase